MKQKKDPLLTDNTKGLITTKQSKPRSVASAAPHPRKSRPHLDNHRNTPRTASIPLVALALQTVPAEMKLQELSQQGSVLLRGVKMKKLLEKKKKKKKTDGE